MLRRRHSNKSKGWIIDRYWKTTGKKWIFAVTRKAKRKIKTYQVMRVCSLGIRRHRKIKAEANPYLQDYALYFHKRRQNKEARLMKALTARAQRALALAG